LASGIDDPGDDLLELLAREPCTPLVRATP
jgi:hypothetical protein